MYINMLRINCDEFVHKVKNIHIEPKNTILIKENQVVNKVHWRKNVYETQIADTIKTKFPVSWTTNFIFFLVFFSLQDQNQFRL